MDFVLTRMPLADHANAANAPARQVSARDLKTTGDGVQMVHATINGIQQKLLARLPASVNIAQYRDWTTRRISMHKKSDHTATVMVAVTGPSAR
jgi:hypothetical protein